MLQLLPRSSAGWFRVGATWTQQIPPQSKPSPRGAPNQPALPPSCAARPERRRRPHAARLQLQSPQTPSPQWKAKPKRRGGASQSAPESCESNRRHRDGTRAGCIRRRGCCARCVPAHGSGSRRQHGEAEGRWPGPPLGAGLTAACGGREHSSSQKILGTASTAASAPASPRRAPKCPARMWKRVSKARAVASLAALSPGRARAHRCTGAEGNRCAELVA